MGAHVRTAFIGAYGYGNLGDELCLIEAMQAFPGREMHAYSVKPDWTRRCVPSIASTFSSIEELRAIKPEVIVYGGGGIGTLPSLDLFSGWMREFQATGVSCHVHNIGVANGLDLSWIDAERLAFFDELDSFSVRDYRSAEIVNLWPINRRPTISYFPERLIQPEFDLAEGILPKGKKILGISIIDMAIMRDCLSKNRDMIQKLLAEFKDHFVLPIVSTIHIERNVESDNIGFQDFAREFIDDDRVICKQLLDYDWWLENLTPRKLKGLIYHCDALISHRKHNCIHGIGSGVRTIGLHPLVDDSVSRTFITLNSFLVEGSRPIGLLS
jgi:hypothetical protein